MRRKRREAVGEKARRMEPKVSDGLVILMIVWYFGIVYYRGQCGATNI